MPANEITSKLASYLTERIKKFVPYKFRLSFAFSNENKFNNFAISVLRFWETVHKLFPLPNANWTTSYTFDYMLGFPESYIANFVGSS